MLLHSKLLSSSWPNVDILLTKILKFVPMMTLLVNIFENESGRDEDAARDELIDKDSKLGKLQVKIYQLKHELIEDCKLKIKQGMF